MPGLLFCENEKMDHLYSWTETWNMVDFSAIVTYRNRKDVYVTECVWIVCVVTDTVKQKKERQ